MIFALSAGLIAGSLHVVSGPDHLAALAPIALEDHRRATRMGAWWGFGHGMGVVCMGGLGLWLGDRFAFNEISEWAEFAVGFLLIGVGIWAFRRASRLTVHRHTHLHGVQEHGHLHSHVGAIDHHQQESAAALRHTHGALGIGMLHGVAGTGHLFGVVPALALEQSSAVVYLGAYLVAAVGAMAGFGMALGRIAKRGDGSAVPVLMRWVGGGAVLLGIAWCIYAWPA